MAPGVVATGDLIEQGAQGWVREERNKRPLVVGWALMRSRELAAKTAQGKCVWTLQYVSDEIWDYGEPE